MPDALLDYFHAHRKLVEDGALDLIRRAPEPLDLSRRLIELAGTDSPFVTRGMVETVLARPLLPPSASSARTTSSPSVGSVSPSPAPTIPLPAFSILKEGFVAAPPGRDPLTAYGALFAARHAALSKLLRGRSGLPDLRTIHELRQREGEVSVVGMIREIRTTSERHHIILTIEDESGAVEVLVPRGSREVTEPFVPDEVVGLRVRVPREPSRIPLVVGVVRPEFPSHRETHRTSHPSSTLFVSDLHIGSKSFLAEAWGRFVDFLRGQGPYAEWAETVRFLVIAGDLVDGIGIYPNQERDLALHDIFDQYAELGRRLHDIPTRIQVVAVPGNHDAVCPAEPQPALPRDLTQSFPPNVKVLANPSTFSLDGVVVTAYHGRSFDDLIPALPGASYARPTDVMQRMLAMRHLAPMYGGKTPLSPQPTDGLVVDPVPDIFVTGHAHTFGADRYRGILLLNASTWQAETEYQRMRNIAPVPARVALVRLNDLSLESLDFLGPRPLSTGGAT